MNLGTIPGQSSTLREQHDLFTIFGFSILIGLQILQRYAHIAYGQASWGLDVDAVWANVATDVANGIPIYVAPAVDNKPPLWQFIYIGILNNMHRPGLFLVAFGGNTLMVCCVYLLAKKRYGYWIGVFSALLLVGMLPAVNGFNPKPHNIASGIIIFGMLFSGSGRTLGASLGVASMFVQYSGLALPAYLLQLRREHGLTKGSLTDFFGAFLTAVAMPFAAIAMIWGRESVIGALYWTFISPLGYVLGLEGGNPTYSGGTARFSLLYNFDYWIDFMMGFVLQHVFIIIPAIGVTLVTLSHRRDRPEFTDVVAGGILLTPFLVRAFPQYWLFSAPFLCLLTGKFLYDVNLTAQQR